jgi:hypothetical protein
LETAVEVIAVHADNAVSDAKLSTGDHGVARTTDNPMFDSQRMFEAVSHANQITNRLGVETISINNHLCKSCG